MLATLLRHRGTTALSSAAARLLATDTSAPTPPKATGLPRQMNPGLVVFDKDGTLIDFQMMWGTWTESLAWRLEMEAKVDIREALFDKLGYDYLRRRVHSGGALCCTPMGKLRLLGEEVLRESKLAMSPADAAHVMNRVWQMPDPVATARPLADLKVIFSTLRAMDMKVAVCTTDDHAAADNTLTALNVRHLVDVVVGGDDPLPSKPSAEQIYFICHKTGVSPHDTIMVGDTSTDMKLGINGGCGLSVGVLDGASSLADLAQYADVLVPTIAKVPKIAFQWSSRAHSVGVATEGFAQSDWDARRRAA